ncbi:Transport system permease protein [Streptomyces venezuelae]|uniref:FecCD family ABC transporter permease n=1 Tax=Streptomyces gardneri TaxID=66892 RepID=UPI0006BD85D9|nr:iron chelate uptake ABC transporter family permease subunit [Streptomyces gardneri]ALO07412.1 Transport system permease protein [Streptomyces venezuelae]QPK44740.1 iron chelate uptake ABC transporter family permease subunit [Streptomyces gardneri]WRK36046.1 iron chelate uptake ABC transporter family permease subunit [Streptomyces venezuelae]CUM42269.1 ABC-type Fe3+-siderophore transport system, permease 2 component [Streptomyces venezuelae]
MTTKTLRAGGGLSVRYEPRAALSVLGLLVLTVAVAVVLIGTGDFPMTPGEVVDTLLGKGTVVQEFAVMDLRLPRVLVAVFVGAALAVGGAVFQSVSRNPLGSPDVIGFGQGATVGALTVIVLFQGSAAAAAGGAVVGGLVTGVTIYLLAWKKGVHGYRLVLVGIGAAAMLTSVIHYLITKANLVDATRATVWMTGSLDGRDWSQFWPLFAVCCVLLPLVLGHGRALRMLEMGDDAAYALGVKVERTRIVLMASAVVLVAVATSAAGPIVFVSLSAPQLARRLTRAPGPNLAASALMGSALLLSADWIATNAFGERQLPVGVVTGILGGCYLLWLLVTERKAGRI